MRSYASIDRIEGKYAVCEVELLPVEESKSEDFAIKDCEMMEVPLRKIPFYIRKVKEGDILVVEHNGENVTWIYCTDEEEKARRLEIRRGIMC